MAGQSKEATIAVPNASKRECGVVARRKIGPLISEENAATKPSPTIGWLSQLGKTVNMS